MMVDVVKALEWHMETDLLVAGAGPCDEQIGLHMPFKCLDYIYHHSDLFYLC